ncbi:phage portal protein [Sphingomonas sp. VNH70]|uniref:phage portal protein n=1 Tax=Sphingomonas silueang TaxID=3156617 RepID=UPI0032B58B6E
MRWWPFGRAAETRSLERGTIDLSTASPEEVMELFGGQGAAGPVTMPVVTIESALEVPAVFDAVSFLSRTMAALPFHAFTKVDGKPQRSDGDMQMLLNEAPNAEWSSFAARQYFWQQVFTVGRGLFWIERAGSKVVALWPMNPRATTVRRRKGRKIYTCEGNEYPAADVIDVPFMLKPDQLNVYSPITKGRDAIGLMIAMNRFAAGFFASGGTPPLALEGPMPSGADGFKRAMADIKRAIDAARAAAAPFFGIPPGYSLKPLAIDPSKGQMTEARLFQMQEIARLYGLPPVFLQDLSKGTFSNTEQQDIQLVKHLIAHWAKALEDECNLKLFGQRRRSRYVQHILDGLQRGDFKARTEALARAIQTGQLTPDEARALEDRPPDPSGAGAKLYMQGATVVLGTTPAAPIGHNGGPPLDENEEKPDAEADTVAA